MDPAKDLRLSSATRDPRVRVHVVFSSDPGTAYRFDDLCAEVAEFVVGDLLPVPSDGDRTPYVIERIVRSDALGENGEVELGWILHVAPHLCPTDAA